MDLKNLKKRLSEEEIPTQILEDGVLRKPKRGRRRLENRIRKVFKIERFQAEKLEELADQRGKPTSELVREALEMYLKKKY